MFGSGLCERLGETALGAAWVACFSLAALILPCALIDMAADTNLLGLVAPALLLAFSAAAILGVVAALQRRYSDDRLGNRLLDKKGTADGDHKSDPRWRK